MEHALLLPKLNLGAALPAACPKFLEPISPPTYPFTSPAWSLPRKPRSIALLDVIKNHEQLATYTVDQKPIYLIGRNAVVCDIVLNHCSISRLHAALIHHKDGATYIVDLGSCHGTFVDGLQLAALQPTLVVHGSQLKFGASSRSYSFKAFESRDQIAEIVNARIGLEPDEVELQQNTLLNRALSYRLGFSIPLTHKTDAEGDDPMGPSASRQIEEPSSAAALIRRTQSEDNTIAGAFPIGTQLLVGGGAPPHGSEPGRKRSRTQSAGLPTTTAHSIAASNHTGGSIGNGTNGSSAGAINGNVNGRCKSNGSGDCSPDSASGLPKRVHFSEHPPETIPHRESEFSPCGDAHEETKTNVNGHGHGHGHGGASTRSADEIEVEIEPHTLRVGLVAAKLEEHADCGVRMSM